jgi:hypothetical protein
MWPTPRNSETAGHKAKELLEGSFHEMGHVAKIVDWRKIVRLYELESEASSIRTDIGL